MFEYHSGRITSLQLSGLLVLTKQNDKDVVTTHTSALS